MYNYYYSAVDGGETPYTDLAIERRRADTDVKGVDYSKEHCPPGIWERVRVRSEEGARSIGRPCGIYDTLTVPRLDLLDEDGIADVQEEIAKRLCIICDDISVMPARILVVGLRNRSVTADSVGPKSATRVKPTAHIREYDEAFFDELECSEIAVLQPGVPAVTGMDTGRTVKAVCEEIAPDVIVAVDSIMTRSRSRLGRSFQISDTGIFPGGMGNLKTPITRGALGVPIISIGVPTVIDSRLFASGSSISEYQFEPLFISPREIDEITDNAAAAIGGAINQAFGLGY
ncbi:MAG: GPR endopeptidase [Clostridia bacterium]|nr:GPR endopeptidase [Clostridia bacterium]